MSDLADTWRRIEAWLSANAPTLAADLGDPAPPSAIAAAEAALGRPLPPELAGSASIHDGQRGAGFELFARWGLLSLDRAVDTWKMLEQVAAASGGAEPPITTHGPVRPVWWSRAWIPFAADGNGDVLTLDMDPANGGQPGQVVLYFHDSERREVLAPGLGAWLTQIADDLEAGLYQVVAGGAKLRRRKS